MVFDKYYVLNFKDYKYHIFNICVVSSVYIRGPAKQ